MSPVEEREESRHGEGWGQCDGYSLGFQFHLIFLFFAKQGICDPVIYTFQ